MKTILKLAAAVVLLVMIGGMVTLQSAIKDARTEQQELSKTSADAGTSAKDDSSPAAESEEVRRLREGNKDLPKLRNEVRKLRRQADEMAKLRADNERLKNAPKPVARQYPPDFIKRDMLRDSGLSTPEAAAQTAIWAMTHGELNRLKECLTSEAAASMLAAKDEASLRRDMEGAKVIPGFRILDKEERSADEVVLKIELIPDLDTGGQEMKFKRVGNEWKLGGM
jgi:hypothetical protein